VHRARGVGENQGDRGEGCARVRRRQLPNNAAVDVGGGAGKEWTLEALLGPRAAAPRSPPLAHRCLNIRK